MPPATGVLELLNMGRVAGGRSDSRSDMVRSGLLATGAGARTAACSTMQQWLSAVKRARSSRVAKQIASSERKSAEGWFDPSGSELNVRLSS